MSKGTKAEYKYAVGYNKKIGGRGIIVVKANNETEALRNAKNLRYTGSNFKVMRKLGKNS